MTVPAVSVVLPTFNRLQYLRAALDSALAQTFRDTELLVADDGSDGETRAWLRRALAGVRHEILWLEHRGNPARARNAALAVARGRYVAFLDSDDRWLPHKLATQLEAMRRTPQRRWSYTAIRRIDAAGGPLAGDERRVWIPFEGSIYRPLLQQRVGLALPSVMAERALIAAAGGFDEAIDVHEDIDLWLRLAQLSEVSVIHEPLAEVRSHAEHYSDHGARSMLAWDRVLAKHEQRLPVGATRRLVRGERINVAIRLARHAARQRDIGTTARALWRSFGRGWWRPRWWRGAALAALRLLAPEAALRREGAR